MGMSTSSRIQEKRYISNRLSSLLLRSFYYFAQDRLKLMYPTICVGSLSLKLDHG